MDIDYPVLQLHERATSKYLQCMYTISQISHNDLSIDFVLLDIDNQHELDIYFALFEKCFGVRKNVDGNIFKWFNIDQKTNQNYNFGFVINGQLVAAYGLLPVDTKINKIWHKSILCTNVMTDPDYAGKGLFVRIGTEAIEYMKKQGYAFCLGIPNANAIKGHLKVGWHVYDDILYYEVDLTHNPENLLNSIYITEVNKFNIKDHEYDKFYREDINIQNKRNNYWLNWRISKPNSKYKKFVYQTAENTHGYIVLKEYYDENNNVKKLHIVDIQSDSDTVLNELVAYSIQYGKLNKFDLLNIWAFEKDERYARILTNNHFSSKGASNNVIIFPLMNSLTTENIGRMHITLFDNDVY